MSILVASWFAYRFLAPKRWREWTRAGLVQAFLIAFYAEMYGFPVTIWIVTRVFGLDVDIGRGGNLWANLVGSHLGMVVAMLVGWVVFVVPGIYLLIRGWRQAHRARREDRLTTDGIYAVVRHPQYLGIIMAIFGEGIVHWPTLASVIFFPVITLAYVWLARKEERELLERFGEQYARYQQRVPMLLPWLRDWPRIFQGSPAAGDGL